MESNTDTTTTIAVRLPNKVVSEIDARIETEGYLNRSDYLRQVIRKTMTEGQ